MMDHMNKLLKIPGSRVLFGGKPLAGHSIPQVYGAIEPTAVFVPLAEALKPEHFDAVTTEVFGPFQVSHQCWWVMHCVCGIQLHEIQTSLH
jgi:1-pyrroline-5-carboxylate dehydrogenase